MHIKFENGSEIHSIQSGDVKRGRRAVLKMYDDCFKMKWYQKLLLKFYCFWTDIDIKIRHWKYWR